MEHVENYFQKKTEASQSLLGRPGDPKRLDQLHKMHHFPSDGRWAQLQQGTIGHNRTLSDTAGCDQTQQNMVGHRRAQLYPAKYDRTQQNISRHEIEEYNQTQQNINRHERVQSDTEGYSQIKQGIVKNKGKNLFEEINTSKENNERLKKLEGKYLLCDENSPPIYSKDSQIEYIIDGVDYFRRVHELIQPTRQGDTIWISGLSLDPHFDLLNKPQGDPDHQELGDVLAEKAVDGVDVRILLASGLSTSSLPFPLPFLRPQWQMRRTLLSAMDLRTRIPKTRNIPSAPLAGRVALDWTGALLGANHQKFVLVSHQGHLTALITGLDFRQTRYDQYPHDTLSLDKKRWGWHDASVLVTGPITESIWENFQLRWKEVSTLPKRSVRMEGLKFGPINTFIEAIPDAPKQKSIDNPEVSLQTLRSFGKRKVDSLLPWCCEPWSLLPRQGIKEIYQCLEKAFRGASRYIYIEDNLLKDLIGGNSAYEIYPFLVGAAKCNVKLILLRSGRSNDGAKVGRRINRDIQKKVLDRLTPEEQCNIVVYHVEHLKVHSKVILVDDEFASVGSANMFSRSMAGVDHELNVALVTTGMQVRDLRVKLWAEHLRSPLGQDLRDALQKQELALGIWHPEWLPETADRQTWRKRGLPKGFEPIEQVLTLVGPE